MDTPLIDRISHSASLIAAWKQVRANRGAGGVDLVTIQKFEADLERNLSGLSATLREERYYPMPLRRAQVAKQDGGTRDIGISTVEDRVAQRAVLNEIEPLFEREFLDCSFGYRPGRSVQDAVARVEELRRKGNGWVVDADIRDFFGSLNHHILMSSVEEKVRDRAVRRLIQMWLDAGCVGQEPLPEPLGAVVRFVEQGEDRVCAAIRSAADRAADRAGWSDEGPMEDPYVSPRETVTSVLKRWGKDAALLALTTPGVSRRLLKARTLAVGGATLLTLAVLPTVGRAVCRRRRAGVVQGGPISPLLANIYLHRFDQAMTEAGYHLVRYADDLIIVCPTEGRAEHALRVVRGELEHIKLMLHERKTRVVSFEEGFRFLGFAFDRDGAYPVSDGWTFPKR